MTVSYVLDKGKVLEKKGVVWDTRKSFIIDAHNPSDKDLLELSKKSNIPLDYLKQLKSVDRVILFYQRNY